MDPGYTSDAVSPAEKDSAGAQTLSDAVSPVDNAAASISTIRGTEAAGFLICRKLLLKHELTRMCCLTELVTSFLGLYFANAKESMLRSRSFRHDRPLATLRNLFAGRSAMRGKSLAL